MVSKPILPIKESLQTVPIAGDCIVDTRKMEEECNASACKTVLDCLGQAFVSCKAADIESDRISVIGQNWNLT